MKTISTKEQELNGGLPPWAQNNIHRTHAELTIESITAVADCDLEEYLADRLWGAWQSAGVETNAFLDALNPGAQAFFVTWLVAAEVENGGFHQLYWNGYEEIAGLAPAAFEYFNAKSHAAVVREAIGARASRKILMNLLRLVGNYQLSVRWATRLEAIDDKYFKLPNVLSARRIEKIKAHPELFLMKKQ
jgi:hypothetical protein